MTAVAGGRVSVKAKTEDIQTKLVVALREEKASHFYCPRKSEVPFKAVLEDMAEYSEDWVMAMLVESGECVVEPTSVVRMRRFDQKSKMVENSRSRHEPSWHI